LCATDYARWKEVFDTHLAARQAGGATNEIHVMRNVDDLNEITILLGWTSMKTARLFAQSVSLNEAMRQAGVIGVSEVRFLEVIS